MNCICFIIMADNDIFQNEICNHYTITISIGKGIRYKILVA